MISVLTPSRGRPEALSTSLSSLLDNASDPEEIEFLVRIDDDDEQQLALPLQSELLIGEPLGYRGMATYYDELAATATGERLLLWNDDAVMETKGWDEVFSEHDGHQLCVICPRNNHDPNQLQPWFPAFPALYYEALGFVARSSHVDNYIVDTCGRAGIVVHDEPRVFVRHERADLTGKNDDATFRARELFHNEYYSPAMQVQIDGDAATLRTWLP